MSSFDETTVIDADTPAERNRVAIVLTGLAAAVAAALLWLFVVSPLLSSDDPTAVDAELAAVDVAAPADETATPAALDAPVDADTLPLVTYEVFLERDPFDPVVPEPVAETATTEATSGEGGVGDTTDGSGGTTDLTGGDTDGTPAPPAPGDGSTEPVPPPPAAGCTTGDELVCDGRVVSLLDIRTDEDGERVAIVQVGSTVYEARVGETFAGTFRVQSISGDQVFLLYGDDGFDLREGDRVLK